MSKWNRWRLHLGLVVLQQASRLGNLIEVNNYSIFFILFVTSIHEIFLSKYLCIYFFSWIDIIQPFFKSWGDLKMHLHTRGQMLVPDLYVFTLKFGVHSYKERTKSLKKRFSKKKRKKEFFSMQLFSSDATISSKLFLPMKT